MELSSSLEETFRLQLKQKKALERLGLFTVYDLLLFLPSRYTHAGDTTTISHLTKGEQAIVYGTLSGLKTKKAFRKKTPMAEATLTDETGKIKIIWFNQAFIAKTFEEGALVRIAGKVSEGKYGLYFSNPEVEKSAGKEDFNPASLFAEEGPTSTFFLPTYPESRGVTSRFISHTIGKVLSHPVFETIEDPMPSSILKKYNLPDLQTALLWIHTPKKESHIAAARKRFAFQEIFFIQLSRAQTRKEYSSYKAYSIPENKEVIDTFKEQLPFSFTTAQEHVTKQILHDMKKDEPMARLLEGDVGSGKTAVAAAVVHAVAHTRLPGKEFGNLQSAYMVPTEILARQQFENFISFFKNTPIQIGFITGKECRKFPSKVDPSESTKISRAQLLKWVANGEIPVLVGTHALIQKKVAFQNLALVIIDEQHRFGVAQRQALAQKREEQESTAPHLLSMTATPIPRTLALTIYGDLDLSLIDQMPEGRKQIITEIVAKNDRNRVYEKIKKELEQGRQAYVICPRIDEPDPEKQSALRVKSAKEEAKRLAKEVFTDYSVGLVHSKLKQADKEEVMKEFEEGDIDVLVATSVVEVGVNVPNATTIIIEGAERFGLAQLHQLRGRVMRSEHQAYCYLFNDSNNAKTNERLDAIITAKNGFELAERDLAIRGEGTLTGAKQWGVSDVGMEAIKNIKMVEAARIEAQAMIEHDPELTKEPQLKKLVNEKFSDLHFE